MASSTQPLLGLTEAQAAQGTVALAYAAEADKRQRKATKSLKITLVTLDCLFLGMQPVLVHLSKNSRGQYSFAPVAVNFLVELTKTIFALITLLLLGTGRPGAPMYRSVRSFIADAHHNKLLAVPALFYAINNYLKFTMQLFFRPTTTKMLGNLKIFTIALLMRVVMKRQFNVIQWEALFLLVAGITVNQLTSSCPVPGEAAAALPPLIPALLCTLGTVTVPSAASVYNEFALKKHMDTSVHLQNFFLYFYGMVFNLVAVLVVGAYQGQGLAHMFAGQSLVTMLLIANNAAQGILSSFFYKFADTILKKYSSTIATIFTAIMSFVMFGHPLTVHFLLGVSIVFISMHQFFTFGDKSHLKSAAGDTGKPQGHMLYSPSLEHISITSATGATFSLPGSRHPNNVSDSRGITGGGQAPYDKADSIGITLGMPVGSNAGGVSVPVPHGLQTGMSLSARAPSGSVEGVTTQPAFHTSPETLKRNTAQGLSFR